MTPITHLNTQVNKFNLWGVIAMVLSPHNSVGLPLSSSSEDLCSVQKTMPIGAHRAQGRRSIKQGGRAALP